MESNMGKKKSRATQTSKGIHCQKPNRYSKQQRREYVGSMVEGKNKRDAWAKGKRVMLTIANPNNNETNKPFIRVPANEVWGDWRGKKVSK